jgi:rubrerythrin
VTCDCDLLHVTCSPNARHCQGYSDVASVFRSTAEGETGHAHGHLEFLQEVAQPLHRPPLLFTVPSSVPHVTRLQVGDPVTDMPMGDTEANLLSAIGRAWRTRHEWRVTCDA